ncbi:MAG TPA: FtsX-like permease family protein [Opitutaceae bacterium]|nr:FtsX-like permease family protein [Opitutaceae bacterium]
MSQNFRIALRFLTAKKRAMLMSLSCIVLGVGLFVVTQATTSGFQEFFIKTILGTNGAIMIQDKLQATMRSLEAGYNSGYEIRQKEGQKYIEGIEYPALLTESVLSYRNVSGVSTVLRGTVVIRSSFREQTGQAYGIVLDEHLRVSDLSSQIVQGSLADFRQQLGGALIGRVIADKLQLDAGDSFEMLNQGDIHHYKVSAIYQTGVTDIDSVRVYLKMDEARALFKKPTGATYLQVSLFDRNRAREDAAEMTNALQHKADAWQDREKSWLGVFRAFRIATGITVSVFTLIAGLAMFNTLAMIVMEKTKEIAILRSMGYTRQDISRIFLWQAAIVLAIGMVLGCALGAGITYAVSQVPLPITGIFTTHKFLVQWSRWHYIEAVVTAVAMVMLASLIPSRRAARLEPGDIIRGTAQ